MTSIKEKTNKVIQELIKETACDIKSHFISQAVSFEKIRGRKFP